MSAGCAGFTSEAFEEGLWSTLESSAAPALARIKVSGIVLHDRDGYWLLITLVVRRAVHTSFACVVFFAAPPAYLFFALRFSETNHAAHFALGLPSCPADSFPP